MNDPWIARPARQAPEARDRLTTFAAKYAAKQDELQQVADALRAERDAAIRAAYKDGMSMQAIAQVLNISHQRVSQVVRS